MKAHLSAMIGWLCLPALVACCSASAATSANSENATSTAIETRASGPAYVAWSDTRPDGDGFLVSGVVRRSDLAGLPVKVTVVVEAVSSSGVILDRAQAETIFVPRRKVNHVQGFERFRVRFPHTMPEGASFRIVALPG